MKYSRNIDYLPADIPLDDGRSLEVIQRCAGSAGIGSAIVQHLLRTDGMQLRVEQALTDELIESDFRNFDAGSIAWPAAAVEFIYEDLNIPSLVLAWATGERIRKEIPAMGPMRDYGPRLMALAQTEDGKQSMFNLYGEGLENALVRSVVTHAEGSVPLTDEENNDMLSMVRLALKVLAYASVPRFTFAPPGQLTRKVGGKPGFKNRPLLTVKRVAVLPAIHTLREQTERNPTGKTVAAHSRRGFFRFFRHDRWVNMKGKWIYVAPVRIRGGQTGPRQAIVKKRDIPTCA